MIINLNNIQRKAIVVSSNTTAVNDVNYTVVANATFTDPTPAEGKGYRVFVRNGAAVVGGISYTVGMSVIRLFHSGSWANYRQDREGLVPQTRTINGLDLSANRTLTTANINDSTDRRYVTDAQLTVIGNTSGTNSGDETQSSILSKLGWIRRLQKGGTVTGTTAETIVHTFSFTANEYPASSILHIESQFVRTGTTANNGTIRVKINTSNTLVGATQIAQSSMGGNTALFSQFRRKFDIESASIKGLIGSSSQVTDLLSSTSAILSASLDTTQDWWLFVTYQPLNSGDTAICNFSDVKNF